MREGTRNEELGGRWGDGDLGTRGVLTRVGFLQLDFGEG